MWWPRSVDGRARAHLGATRRRRLDRRVARARRCGRAGDGERDEHEQRADAHFASHSTTSGHRAKAALQLMSGGGGDSGADAGRRLSQRRQAIAGARRV